MQELAKEDKSEKDASSKAEKDPKAKDGKDKGKDPKEKGIYFYPGNEKYRTKSTIV